jgi:hypothetical protein
MTTSPRHHSPETRQRADARLRRLTRSAAVIATGATIAIGVLVAKEHSGASASSNTGQRQVQTISTPGTSTTTSPPTTTTTRPVVTSGGTSR